jgi:hypothetical protein
MTDTGLYIIIGALTFVLIVFVYLIKTAPYGIETKDGIVFFKTKQELEKYLKEHQNES